LSTYFLSDLHIAAPDGPRTETLLAFLRGLDDAETIYLVGDVFDFWLGYKHALFSAMFPLLRTLADLVDRGVRVVLFSGNHDPDPGPFLTKLGLEVHEGPLEITLSGQRVRLEHGDVIDPRGWAGRLVCKTARRPAVRALARLVHPDWAWALARRYAHSHSDNRADDYAHALPSAFFDTYLPEQAARGVDVLVIGHYHRAVHHRATHAQRPVQLFALGDWVAQRTYLRFSDGQFTLLRHHPHRPDTPLPLGDHGPESPVGPPAGS
jgi:UDP-2,3-diacylglucosamine hydrolase